MCRPCPVPSPIQNSNNVRKPIKNSNDDLRTPLDARWCRATNAKCITIFVRGLPYHACCNRTWNQWGARNLNLDTPEEELKWRKWTKVSCCNYFLTGILFSFMILFILYSYNFSTVYNFITPAQQQIFAILFVLTNYYRNSRLSYNFSIVHLAIFLLT